MNAREAEGTQLLADALTELGLTVRAETRSHARPDLVISGPAGLVSLEVKRLALATEESVVGGLPAWAAHLPAKSVGVVVADRVTEGARRQLRGAGWGWLDLRGHLHLASSGIFIDADVPMIKEVTRRSGPLAGRVSLEVATALLLDPDESWGVRQLAQNLGRAPSSVSEALAALKEEALVDDGGRPLAPQLFWEVVERWASPARASLASLPQAGSASETGALRLGFDAEVGWALTGTRAAVAYGARAAIRSDEPPTFYVTDEVVVRRASQLLGVAQPGATPAARVIAAPVPAACALREEVPGSGADGWLLTRPLFVALELAQDPGRGREILESWTPSLPHHRVW